MEPLTRDVIYATGLPRQVARIAIACVLVFLSRAAPNGELAGCAERLRQEIIAAARRDSGMAAVEQLANLDALSCADVATLATTLANIGLHPAQIIRTASEVVTYAEKATGASGASGLHRIVPALSDVLSAWPTDAKTPRR